MNILIQYLNNKKWYLIGGLIGSSMFAHLFNLITYRKITDFINSSHFTGSTCTFVSFFVHLLLIHLSQTLIKYALEKIISTGIKDLFKTIMGCIMFNTMDFFKRDISGKINQIWAYLNNIEIMMEKILIDFPKILTFMIYYIYVIYSSYPKILFVIIPINILLMIILHPFSKKQHKLQKEKILLDIDTKNRILEATSNIEFVKLNSKETHEINRIDSTFNKYMQNKMHDKFIGVCSNFLSQLFNDYLSLIIYSIGLIYIIDKTMSPIDLVYLAINTGNFCQYIIQTKEIYNYYKKTSPRIEIIYHILNSNNKLPEDSIYLEKNFNNSKDIVFQDITFSYDGKTNVIDNLNFEFINNKINLLFGPNRCGKSTIIKLLMRLHELDDNGGNIFYKGINTKQIALKDLRKKIVFVSQEPCIFNETIAYNIKYGTENIDDNAIADLCEIIYSRDWFINNKNKITGFRGKNLSGGEKKKIQLINAICRDPEIIIFDEPTNTLDSNSIKWFNEFVKLLKDKFNKTIVIITHDSRLKETSDHIIDLYKKQIESQN